MIHHVIHHFHVRVFGDWAMHTAAVARTYTIPHTVEFPQYDGK